LNGPQFARQIHLALDPIVGRYVIVSHGRKDIATAIHPPIVFAYQESMCDSKRQLAEIG
jgi:hypothetical protein